MSEYIYVLVRTDLPLEQQMVQACHACTLTRGLFDTHLILLAVKDELSIITAQSMLKMEGIEHHVFFEPIYKGKRVGYTALATEILKEDQRRIFSEYKLWRKKGFLYNIRRLISRIVFGN